MGGEGWLRGEGGGVYFAFELDLLFILGDVRWEGLLGMSRGRDKGGGGFIRCMVRTISLDGSCL